MSRHIPESIQACAAGRESQAVLLLRGSDVFLHLPPVLAGGKSHLLVAFQGLALLGCSNCPGASRLFKSMQQPDHI